MPKYLLRFTSKATKPLMGLAIKFERVYKRSRSKQKVIVAADWKMMLKVYVIIKKEEEYEINIAAYLRAGNR